MVVDAVKAYVQIANGLTEVSKERAKALTKTLASQPGETLGGATAGAASVAAQVQGLAEELVLTARDNRALLLGIVRAEAERVVAALGFAREAEVEAVRAKVDRLEEALGIAPPEPDSGTDSLRAALSPAKKAPPKKKAPATKVAAKKAPAKKVAPKKVAAKKVAARKAPAKKAAAAEPADQPPVMAVPPPEVIVLDRAGGAGLDAPSFEASVLEDAALGGASSGTAGAQPEESDGGAFA